MLKLLRKNNHDLIEIKPLPNKLTKKFKNKVFNILYESFAAKLHNLIFYSNDRSAIKRLIMKYSQMDFMLYAFNKKNNSIIGIVAFDNGKRGVDHFPFHFWLKEFGFIKGFFRGIFHLFKKTKVKKGHLRISFIAVSVKARGQGIGSKMLAACEKFAKNHKYNCLALEVVDTNPRAKSLYEKLGFKTIKKINTKWITSNAGFTKVFYMEKKLI